VRHQASLGGYSVILPAHRVKVPVMCPHASVIAAIRDARSLQQRIGLVRRHPMPPVAA
jgi:hypothetical protein